MMIKRMKKFVHDETVEAEDFRLVPTIKTTDETRVFTFSPNNSFPSNFVSHQKYTAFNIIPKFLFLQFRFLHYFRSKHQNHYFH